MIYDAFSSNTLRPFLAALSVCITALTPGDAGAQNVVPWSDAAHVDSDALTDGQTDFYPCIESDGAGTWIAAWSRFSLDPLGSDDDLFFARSTDNGENWSASTPLNNDAATDNRNDLLPQLATDGKGIWLAAWTEVASSEQAFYVRSLDNGLTWSDPAELADGVSFDPQIRTDGDGNWLAVYVAGSTLSCVRSTNNGESWSDPVPVSADSVHELAFPQLSTNTNGTWIAVWGWDEIFAARSIDNGQTWTKAIRLNTEADVMQGEGGHRPHVAAGANDTVLVVWKSNSDMDGTIGLDPDIVCARSTDGGLAWSNPAPVNTNAPVDIASDDRPYLATDGRGLWVAVWELEPAAWPTADAELSYAVSGDAGLTWTDPETLNSTADTDDGVHEGLPRIATDKQGNWVTVWTTNTFEIDVATEILFATASFGDELWVDFSFSGHELGTQSNPLSSLHEANQRVRSNGDVHVMEGASSENVILDQPATYRSVDGTVWVGSRK